MVSCRVGFHVFVFPLLFSFLFPESDGIQVDLPRAGISQCPRPQKGAVGGVGSIVDLLIGWKRAKTSFSRVLIGFSGVFSHSPTRRWSVFAQGAIACNSHPV